MSRFSKLRPSPALAVAIAAMVVALAGVAFAGPAAHTSGGPLNKKKVKNIARNIVASSALSKTAVRTATVSGNGTVTAGQGITQANVSRASAGQYCITGLSPAPKNAVVSLDFSETGFKSQEYVSMGPGGNCPAGTQIWVITPNDANAPTDARFHLAVFSD